MNQILSMDPNNPSFGNNYNNMNNGGNNKKFSTKTSKRIFAISLMVFGLVMFIIGLMGIMTYLSTPKGPVIQYPIIQDMQTDNVVTITVENNVAIDYIEYSWNGERVQEFSGEGNLKLVRDIIAPVGENTLYLNIVDVKGKSKEWSKVFVGTAVEDKTPPLIEVVLKPETGKLDISVKSVSETKLSYATYKWNEEPEIRLEAIGDQTSIDTTIDVKNGTNTLTIVAVNEKGIKETKVESYKGIVKPDIQVKTDETGNYLLITITHDSGVKAVETIFNDKNVVLTSDRFGQDKTVVEYKLRLKSGQNNLKITATSMDDSVDTFIGTKTK